MHAVVSAGKEYSSNNILKPADKFVGPLEQLTEGKNIYLRRSFHSGEERVKPAFSDFSSNRHFQTPISWRLWKIFWLTTVFKSSSVLQFSISRVWSYWQFACFDHFDIKKDSFEEDVYEACFEDDSLHISSQKQPFTVPICGIWLQIRSILTIGHFVAWTIRLCHLESLVF